MSENQEAAKYRTQRNSALKEVQSLRALLKSAGVDDSVVNTAVSVLGVNEVTVEDGKVSNFAISEQQQAVLDKLVKKAEPEKPTPDPDPEPEPDATVEAVKKVLQEMGIEPKGSNATKVPGAPQPSEGTPKPGGGMTREAVQAMTPEQINSNWETISQALSNGSLNATPQ